LTKKLHPESPKTSDNVFISADMDDRCRLAKFCNSLKTKPKIRLKIRIKEVKNDTTFTAIKPGIYRFVSFLFQFINSRNWQNSNVHLSVY